MICAELRDKTQLFLGIGMSRDNLDRYKLLGAAFTHFTGNLSEVLQLLLPGLPDSLSTPH